MAARILRRIRRRVRREPSTTTDRPAEVVALERSFSYLHESIDPASVIPVALSEGLITAQQRSECSGEADAYKQAEKFLGHLLRAVNGNQKHFHTFLQVLEENGQKSAAARLRDELSMVLPTLPSHVTVKKGKLVVKPPEIFLEELSDLRDAYAKLLMFFEKELERSSEAQEDFVRFLQKLLQGAIPSNCNFHSAFKILMEKELSLFNIYRLKHASTILPEEVRTATKQLISSFEEHRSKFMESTTLAQFKELFPTSTTTSRLSAGKKPVTMKVQSNWGEQTLKDLEKLKQFLGDPGSCLHLSEIVSGCIAVHWLCPTGVVPQLEEAITAAAKSLHAEGVQEIFIGDRAVLNPTKDILRKEFHFITEPSQAVYLCPVCTDLLMEPFLTDCGHHLCRMCRDHLLANNQAECPSCHKPNALKDVKENKHLQQQVYDLKVYCKHHEDGCKWTGELRNLQEHLDPKRRSCDFVLIPCSFGCGEQVLSGMMKEHKKSHCHKRPSTCEHCGYHNTHDVVTEEHYPICPQFPVECPNKCQAGELKRHQLQAHINRCTLQEIECPYTSVGCNVRLPRREMETHTEQQHLLPVPKQMGPLVEDVTLPTLPVCLPYIFKLPPVEFTMTDYLHWKESGKGWTSPPFYTHPQGYKMCLRVYASGFVSDKGTHASVFACLVSGEHDDQLLWPFEGDVVIELLNWEEDKGHQEYTVSFNRYRSITSGARVTDRDVGGRWGTHQLISHSSLSYNPTTNTKYLQDDCLRLRVKTVAVYSTPHLLKTPAWQDSLTASQSLCEFTVTEFSKRKHFNNQYYSPPFYTHPQGYKMCLRVFANGGGSGNGTHVSVLASLMRGEHDDQLQWPFNGDVIIELLNWKRDRRHHKHTIHFNSYSESVSAHCARVTDRDIGGVLGGFQFISHSSLSYNHITNTEYLQDDCLRLRVSAVVPSNRKQCVIA